MGLQKSIVSFHALDAFQKRMWDPVAGDTTPFGHRTWRNHAGADPEAPPQGLALLASEGARQAAKGEKQSVVLPEVKSVKCSHDPPSKISPMVQSRHR